MTNSSNFLLYSEQNLDSQSPQNLKLIDSKQLTQSIRNCVESAGFGVSGITPAVDAAGFSRLEAWLDAGFAGEMQYLSDRKEAYRNPNSVMPDAKSVVMLTMNYFSQPRGTAGSTTGKIARYAWGDADYHDLIHQKFKEIKQLLLADYPELGIRCVVDTAPLLEREFAQAAGLGWFGKNTMLINKHRGSWFFLAAILVDQELTYDAPHQADHCGTCTACLEACPTDAFPQPGVLDATRCISYLTIEHRSPVDEPLRSKMGDWILGCDVCQDVCPWNRKATVSDEPAFQPLEDQNPIELTALFQLDDAAFRERFRKTPLWRPRRRGILRNAAIALGNNIRETRCSQEELKRIRVALKMGMNDVEPLVRGASVWAVGQLVGSSNIEHQEVADWISALESKRETETDPDVQQELDRVVNSFS